MRVGRLVPENTTRGEAKARRSRRPPGTRDSPPCSRFRSAYLSGVVGSCAATPCGPIGGLRPRARLDLPVEVPVAKGGDRATRRLAPPSPLTASPWSRGVLHLPSRVRPLLGPSNGAGPPLPYARVPARGRVVRARGLAVRLAGVIPFTIPARGAGPPFSRRLRAAGPRTRRHESAARSYLHSTAPPARPGRGACSGYPGFVPTSAEHAASGTLPTKPPAHPALPRSRKKSSARYRNVLEIRSATTSRLAAPATTPSRIQWSYDADAYFHGASTVSSPSWRGSTADHARPAEADIRCHSQPFTGGRTAPLRSTSPPSPTPRSRARGQDAPCALAYGYHPLQQLLPTSSSTLW